MPKPHGENSARFFIYAGVVEWQTRELQELVASGRESSTLSARTNYERRATCMSTPKGAKGSMTVMLQNFSGLREQLQGMDEAAERAVKRTVSDFKSRAPGWIGSAVTEHYGIKKSDVKDAITGTKKAGKINIGGVAVDNVAIEYSGRPLTPTHFKMKPTRVPAKREKEYKRVPGAGVGEGGSDVAMVKAPAPYSITAEIKKGKRVTIGDGKAFLGTNKGTGVIPFQRSGDGRTPIKSVKTLSVPQMITNPDVAEQIQKNIDEGLTSRLQHHVEQELKKRGK